MRRALTAIAALLLTPALLAQQPAGQNAPRLGYVYPAGAQRGTKIEVVVGGQFLNGASAAIVSGRGVRASVASIDLPMTAQQITAMRDEIQALTPKATDAATRQRLADMRAKLGDSLQRNRNPVLGDRVTIEVTVEADAALGPRLLRVQTPLGLSAPVTFMVGQLPEVRERDVKNTRADAELPITLPVTVNGRMIPGDIDNVRQPLRQPAEFRPGDTDRYRFFARTGQHLVVTVEARTLMPYLADAVPGWFQAVATLYDPDGREIAYCDDYRFSPDPVLHYEAVQDGEYVLEIHDAIYRGREDFVYRATIGELPFITSIFPLGGATGARTTVELAGWNLPTGRMTMAVDRTAGIKEVFIRAGSLESNRVSFDAGSLPERSEREPNNDTASSQSIAMPAIVNGRIAQSGDWDVYSFKARKGEPLIAEVIARRLGSPLDSTIELLDSRGARLVRSDDMEARPDGLATHQADAVVMTTLPADGTYFLRIGDVQHQGGPEFGYRLRLDRPHPDFQLRVSPSAINSSTSANIPITATVIRRDGFSGDVVVTLENAPSGSVLTGGLIPSGQDRARMTITAPATGTQTPDEIHIVGHATIDGRTVTRDAVPADDRQQAFAYHHLVDADALRLSVTGRGGTRAAVRVVDAQPLKIAPGGLTRVHVILPPAFQTFENLQFELSEPPDGITLGETVIGLNRSSASFAIRAGAKTASGFRANLIVLMTGERVPPPNAQGQAARRRVPLGALPAISLEVVR